MKKILLIIIACFTATSFADEEITKKTSKENLTYITANTFTLMTIPYGVNIGIGNRRYGDIFAFGTSINLSANFAIAPLIDCQAEVLCFIDKNVYVGIQAGLGIGKMNCNKFAYSNQPGIYIRKGNIAITPLVKIIPFGMEWGKSQSRKFFHISLFPGGAAFNYGWAL